VDALPACVGPRVIAAAWQARVKARLPQSTIQSRYRRLEASTYRRIVNQTTAMPRMSFTTDGIDTQNRFSNTAFAGGK
jgi:hypothetical protein